MARVASRRSVGGVGLLRTQIDGGTVARVSSSDNMFGWDAGVRLLGGLRRRLSCLDSEESPNIPVAVPGSHRSVLHYHGTMVELGSSMLASAFAPISGGWFTMGTERGQEDERPPHRVFVDRFELGVFPVTRAEYECFMDATGHEPPRDWLHPPFAQPDLPVVGVSWLDATAYCAWRSQESQRPVRLPTEAEWEFAARGRQEALFPWGDAMPDWIPNGGRGPLEAPWPVTLGEPTDFGLFGIATNVHEWCADWHDKDYYSRSPELNPGGPDHGVRRTSRGGAWRHVYTMCRVTLRSKLDPSFRYNDYGFRLARNL